LRKLWKRELQALADGKPLKKWVMTDAVQEPVPLI
jgi:hypothetical protein